MGGGRGGAPSRPHPSTVPPPPRTCLCCSAPVPLAWMSNSCVANLLGRWQSSPNAMCGPVTMSIQNPRRSRVSPRSRPWVEGVTTCAGGRTSPALSCPSPPTHTRAHLCIGRHGPVRNRVRLVAELKRDARLPPVPVVHEVHDGRYRPHAHLVVPVDEVLAEVVAFPVVVAQPLVTQRVDCTEY